MNNFLIEGHWLPLAFAFLMGLAILLYVILDGYDLGIGILLNLANDKEKDAMIASIGPFWDANETWLVLGVGILLVAFPFAHGVILTALYLPATLMLMALILRGVSFDFRVKVAENHKHLWNKLFFAGSLMATFLQGYMLGIYVMGFKNDLIVQLFSILTGICVVAGYAFIGAGFLIMKTTGQLQIKAIKWAKISLWFTAIGIILISLATPAANDFIFNKWFTMPNIILLAPIPLITATIIVFLSFILSKMPLANDRLAHIPFVGAVAIFILCFHGLAYSFYPFIIPQKMTIFEAAASLDSLLIIFIAAVIVLPCIVGYTIFVYRVFWGKVQVK